MTTTSKKHDNKILNMSYVLTSSNDFSETLDNILKGLNSVVFTRNDCRVIRTRTLESVTNNTIPTQTQVEQSSIFDNNSNEGSVVKKSLLSRNDDEEFKRLLSLVPEESAINHCRSRLIGELNNRFDCIDQASIGRYVDRIISSLTTEDEIIALNNNIMTISLRLKNHINDLLAEYGQKHPK